ncbi:porin family protein [Hymenobacter ruricola]|uniref:PorT family protein n=1 Tax=Hymenobacter ruricola TaxID=2791023 RepID=A0ABS0I4F1_9BACT|nr:porin family protein [Hymenobacter ruricola]MBF9221780.1 PorT family protein [Hymenobacter ruricola]
MKKTLTTLALLLGAAGAAQAQHAPSFGLTAAYGRDRILSNNQYTSVSHSAYQAGLTADFGLSDNLSFHPEVLYSMRYFDTSNDEDLNRDVTSIDVPLLARYRVGGLFFEAGPEVGFPIKAVNEDADNVKDELNSVVLNYVAGVGYRFGKGPSLGVRYDGGASNVFKSNTATVLGAGKFKTSAVWLVLAYSFGG